MFPLITQAVLYLIGFVYMALALATKKNFYWIQFNICLCSSLIIGALS